MAAASPRIKGAAIREIVRWYLREHGAPGVPAILDTLPEALRAGIDSSDETLGVMPNTWYDSAFVFAMLDGLVAPYPPPERARMLHAAARAAVESSAKGVYGFLIAQLATPALYARNIQRLWRMLHDTGKRSIVIEEPGRAVSLTWDWPGHHPILCELNQQTLAAIFEKMGETEVRVLRVACVADGANACEHHVHWKPRGR